MSIIIYVFIYIYFSVNNIDFNQWDVDYIVQEIWHHRSPISGEALGVRLMELVRWDKDKPSDCTNLVLMTKEEMIKHDNIKSLDEYDSEIV